MLRRCSRTGCTRQAVATLTYAYSDLTAVVGPLASFAEPHSYDLCEQHAVRLTVPRGWEVVRHAGEFPAPIPHADDLEALADAVRDAARADVHGALEAALIPNHENPDARPDSGGAALGGPAGGRRGHLRVVPPPFSPASG